MSLSEYMPLLIDQAEKKQVIEYTEEDKNTLLELAKERAAFIPK